MAVFLLFVLVGAGVFLDTSEAQEDISTLSGNYREGVKLAVEQINSHQSIKSVFLFFKSLDKSDIDVSIFIWKEHTNDCKVNYKDTLEWVSFADIR